MNVDTEHTERTAENEQTTTKFFLWEVVKFILLAAIIVLPIRVYVAQPFLVSGPSMQPTFSTGDYLIVDEITYRYNNPQRGDVVVLKSPRSPDTFLIKRIIGLPNETVKIQEGRISIASPDNPFDITLDEPYVADMRHTTLTEELGPNEYFVLGDNRTASLDSRVFGPVPRDHIEGRALVQLFPLTEIRMFPGKHRVY